MNTPNEEFFKNPIVNPRYIRKYWSEFYEYLKTTYPDIQSISESLYLWKNNLKCPTKCPVCGKQNHFQGISKGYSQCCSIKCSNNYIDKKFKTKQTCIEKYGVDNPTKSAKIKEKTKQTCIEKYGVDNPSKSELIKEKISNVCKLKYGHVYFGQVPGIKEKIVQTFRTNHPGELYSIQSEYAKNQLHQSRIKYITDVHPDIISVNYDMDEFTCKCPHQECRNCIEKNYNIKRMAYYDRKRNNTEPCTRLLPFDPDRCKNTSLEIFVKNILDLNNIEYLNNCRDIINGKEIDIYIPSKKLALECNGLPWHSTIYKTNKYHLDKYNMCKCKDIQLMSIWADWIQNKPHIVESIILSKLGIYSERIGARQCKIREIDSRTCNNFLNQNHIQGATQSKVHLGLYYKDDLVAVMTFGHKRAGQGNKEQNKDIWELSRFCSLLNTQIIGGSERLMKYFIKHYNPSSIYSFSCHDISNGNLYKKLGFKESGDNLAYWYIESRTFKRYHRSVFTKQSIIERGWKESKEGWIESDVMKEHGYFQIYDSGQTKWTLSL